MVGVGQLLRRERQPILGLCECSFSLRSNEDDVEFTTMIKSNHKLIFVTHLPNRIRTSLAELCQYIKIDLPMIACCHCNSELFHLSGAGVESEGKNMPHMSLILMNFT